MTINERYFLQPGRLSLRDLELPEHEVDDLFRDRPLLVYRVMPDERALRVMGVGFPPIDLSIGDWLNYTFSWSVGGDYPGQFIPNGHWEGKATDRPKGVPL